MVARPATRPGRGSKPRMQAVLLFFFSPRSGPSRRMDGLVSWLYVRERKRLRLKTIDVDRHVDIAERFRVKEVPTLLLVKDRRVVVRLEGRVTGRQIDSAILPHLRDEVDAEPAVRKAG
jgi:thioredoxin-like negative regulator of GroEL